MPTFTRKELIELLTPEGYTRIGSKPLSRALHRELDDLYAEHLNRQRPQRLSPSQVETWRMCQLRWYYKYRRGWREPSNAPKTLGSSVDRSANHNYTEKIKTGRDEPLSVLTDVFIEDFRERFDDTDWQEDKPKDVEEDGLRYVKRLREVLAPTTHPLEVQPELHIEFEEGGYTFIGFPDLVCYDLEGGDPLLQNVKIIADLKVWARMVKEDVAQCLETLTGYNAMYCATHGITDNLIDIPLVALDIVPKTKKCFPDRVVARRTFDDHKRFWRTVEGVYQQMCNAVEKNAWTPALKAIGAQTNWICTKKWCGYYDKCHEEF